MNEYSVIAEILISIPIEADNDGIAYEKARSMLTVGDYDFDLLSSSIKEVALISEEQDAQG